MREIKFRAYDKAAGKMVHTGVQFSNTKMEFELAPGVSLMQYTGLKANGKEIYEGDIIAFPTYNTEIKWNNKYAGWEPWVTYIEGSDSIEEGDPVEVIGNIYENPELLK